MKKTICFLLAFIILQLSLINITVFAADVASDEINHVTLTEREVLDAFYDDTQTRIDEIHNTKETIQPANGSKGYYVSNQGNDNNDGLSPNTPIATISAVNKLNLQAGDVVYFQRGGVWRGSVKAYTDGVAYSAYGEGNKPELYGSSYNYAEVGEWIETDAPNVYKYSKPIKADVGNIIFNNGEANGIKCVIAQQNGVTYNTTTGKEFDTYADLKDDLHFFHNSNGSKELYLCSLKGNPSDLYESIEFAEGIDIIETKWSDNITIDNITFRYSGNFAVSALACEGLTVQNCEFYWIGGSIQYDAVRFGNGVQIWGQAKNFTVDNCYFNQIYDAAVTFQFSGDTDRVEDEIHCENINFTNNVMEYCNYSVEYFLDHTQNTVKDFKDFTISGNHMWYAGYGLCSQRADKGHDAHIKSWKSANVNKGNFNVNNNVFAIAKTYIAETYSMNENEGANYDSNTYIQFLNRNMGRNHKMDYFVRFTENVGEKISEIFGDNNAKIIWVKPNENEQIGLNGKPVKMIFGDTDINEKLDVNDCTLISKYLVKSMNISNTRLEMADVNQDGIVSISDVTCIQKYIAEMESNHSVAGQAYEPKTYSLYLKTEQKWIANDTIPLYVYDHITQNSYKMERISTSYPYTYTVELPVSVTDISVYRFTEAVYEPPVTISGEQGNVYTCWDMTVSPVKNLIRMGYESEGLPEEYYEEPVSDYLLRTVYFDNSIAKWDEVYIFGWDESGLEAEAVLMTKIDGTDIWYYTFDIPLVVGAECFLFKDTKDAWQNQTDNMIVREDLNCYRGNEGNKNGGRWYCYTE